MEGSQGRKEQRRKEGRKEGGRKKGKKDGEKQLTLTGVGVLSPPMQ